MHGQSWSHSFAKSARLLTEKNLRMWMNSAVFDIWPQSHEGFIPSKDKNFLDSTVKFYVQYKEAKAVSLTHVTVDYCNCNNLKSACCNRGVNRTSLKCQNEKRCPFLQMHFYFKSMLQMKEISVAKVAKGCIKCKGHSSVFPAPVHQKGRQSCSIDVTLPGAALLIWLCGLTYWDHCQCWRTCWF